MIRSKTCFKCNEVKDLDEFYVHAKMADGHLNKCKECTKSDANRHRLDNLDKVRAYDRDRASAPHRKAKRAEIRKRWLSQDKRRNSCHLKVRRAIAKGLLIKQPCKRCGAIKVIAHHEDYDKPLDVLWLCQPCHKIRHKELKEIQKPLQGEKEKL